MPLPRLTWSLLLALTLICTAAARVSAQSVTLIRDGRPLGRIFVEGPIMTAEELDAARNARRRVAIDPNIEARSETVIELNYHLTKMSGTGLEVVAIEPGAKVAIKGPGIVLGSLAVELGAKPQKTTESSEGFRILTKNNLVLIGGQADRAALLGAMTLLEQFGCDWVMPGEIGEVIPVRPTVEVAKQDFSSAPDFVYRRVWYRGYPQPRLKDERDRLTQWLLRQRGGTWSHPAMGVGGHVWDQFIKRHKDEFEKDPTMYALRRAPDGTLKRMGPQLESTHPRVIELFVQEIRDTYKKKIEAGEWTKDTPAGFGIGPADGLGYSLSAESMLASSGRIDPIVGDPDTTDLLVLLGNEILERITPEYPNVYVGFYSYSTHADYPARYKPHPNLAVIFAPINFSRMHGIGDVNSKTQGYYRRVVEQWGKLGREQGNKLIYRGYNWNLAENMLPYSKARIWGEELPFYKAQGFLGMNVEATKAWSINGPGDYIFMKLAWDSSQDWEQLLVQYSQRAFGPAAEPMHRLLRRIVDTQHAAGREAGSYHSFNLIYSPQWVEQARQDLNEALALATDTAHRTRIEYVAHSITALQLYLDYHAATLRFDFAKAKDLYEAMHQHWQRGYESNTDIVANETPAYLKRFLSKFVDQAVQYSSGEYRMVYAIPDELPTMFDPHIVGHQMNYHRPEINDSDFVRTRTISTTWDAQGLTGLRSGAVWYRVRFSLPADVKGKPVGLFVGGVEDEARVWINGKTVGTSGRGFSVPFVFDLTDGINYDGENLVAIQVVRNSAANEIGLGGLIRPSFIFTGPQLATKAPKPLELRRILPGGELGEIEE